jgi:hypothetical protein
MRDELRELAEDCRATHNKWLYGRGMSTSGVIDEIAALYGLIAVVADATSELARRLPLHDSQPDAHTTRTLPDPVAEPPYVEPSQDT